MAAGSFSAWAWRCTSPPDCPHHRGCGNTCTAIFFRGLHDGGCSRRGYRVGCGVQCRTTRPMVLGLAEQGAVLCTAAALLRYGRPSDGFGYFRGLERVQMANLVSFGGTVVVPLLALATTYKRHSAPILIGAAGVGLTVVSFFWAIPRLVAVWRFGQQFLRDARQLLAYG